jgi:hypothetical protein
VQKSVACCSIHGVNAVSEQDEHRSGGQSEASPGGNRAPLASANESDVEADLAACGPWQELAKPDEVGQGMFVDPLSAHDEFFSKVADVRDRAAKASQAEPDKDPQNLNGEPIGSFGEILGSALMFLTDVSGFDSRRRFDLQPASPLADSSAATLAGGGSTANAQGCICSDRLLHLIAAQWRKVLAAIEHGREHLSRSRNNDCPVSRTHWPRCGQRPVRRSAGWFSSTARDISSSPCARSWNRPAMDERWRQREFQGVT